MLVFFRNIPPTTRKIDLIEFITPAFNFNFVDKFFRSPGAIVDIKLVNLLDKEKNTLNVHGLVRINPDDAAERVIKRLNRKTVNGRRISVREYQARSAKNDPRSAFGNISKEILNRRKGDRRRKNLEVVASIITPAMM